MSTEAQICANHANSQHSTGPKTGEGKAASCMNNFRWGLTGTRFAVLDWEDQEEYDLLESGLRHDFKPQGFAEMLLVEKMAQAQWLSKRALYLQDSCLGNEEPALAQQEKQLALFIRYQTTHDRAFHRCLNDLLKLRAEKRKVEIGFESQKQREAAESRREAVEKRKQDRHNFDILLAEAKVDHQLILNSGLKFENHCAATTENLGLEAQDERTVRLVPVLRDQNAA